MNFIIITILLLLFISIIKLSKLLKRKSFFIPSKKSNDYRVKTQ
jgi:hypothetical protein